MGKNQHYIPQFYQKLWECEQKGRLWELDKRYKNNADKGIRMQAIRNRNSEEYLYEADKENPNNIIENWYGRFETAYSEHYKKLIDSRACLCKISDKDKLLLCRMFANLSARNQINLYNNQKNNEIASHFTLGEQDSLIDKRYIQNLVAFAEGEMAVVFERENENENLQMLGEFAGKLYSYNVQILFSPEDQIVFCDNIIEQVSYQDEYFFPLHPSMLAVFSGSQCYEDKSIRKITSKDFEKFVRLYLENDIVKRIYANNKDILESLI